MIKNVSNKAVNSLGAPFEVIDAPVAKMSTVESKSPESRKKAPWLSSDKFVRVAKRTGAAALAGFGTAAISGLPLGYINGFVANTVLHGESAFLAHQGDITYTAIGQQTSSTFVSATAAHCLLGFPAVAVLDSLLQTSAKPYQQPISLTLTLTYLSGSVGALAGLGIGTLMGLTVQTAFGTDSQVGYDAARLFGASAGAGAAVLGLHLLSE